MQPSVDVIKALGVLDGNREFGIVMDWLKSNYESEVAKLIAQPNPVLVHQSQGYAMCLADIIRTVTSNNSVLSRLGQGARMNT